MLSILKRSRDSRAAESEHDHDGWQRQRRWFREMNKMDAIKLPPTTCTCFLRPFGRHCILYRDTVKEGGGEAGVRVIEWERAEDKTDR